MIYQFWNQEDLLQTTRDGIRLSLSILYLKCLERGCYTMATGIKKLWKWIIFPYKKIKEEIHWRKRVKRAKKLNPFIYEE